MASGYNTSLAAGKTARGKARTRTPVFYWLDVPMYVYELPCGTENDQHLFRSRTPATTFDGQYVFWCDRCREYRSINALTHPPVNRMVTGDEQVRWKQDRGILQERVGRYLNDRGYLSTDEEIAEVAARNWTLDKDGNSIDPPTYMTTKEIRRINAALEPAPGDDGLPDVCQAGLHEMTPDNIRATRTGRRCQACYLTAKRESAQRTRQRTKMS